MKQEDVIRFFDRRASTWDSNMFRSEAVIRAILDNADVCEGADILDVACGTGVLFPDYLARGVRSMTAIDISPEMVKIAQTKYPQIRVLCGDAETYVFPQKYDVIMIYNAFPHFPEPARVIYRLAQYIKLGGRFSIAHGMSRERLALHHAGQARSVSIELPDTEELAGMLVPWFDVKTVISDDNMFQIVGTRFQ